MKYLIASFHNGNLPAGLLEAQRQVFKHHGIPLVQWESRLPHGEAMDECLAAHPDWEVAALFDADAFPREPEWLSEWMANLWLEQNIKCIEDLCGASIDRAGIIGGAHNANHRKGATDYASPACCIVSRQAYDQAGCGFKCAPDPSGSFYDAGEQLSVKLAELGYRVALIFPKTVREPKWRLQGGINKQFGNGTDYGKFYHEFESRCGEGPSRHFIAKVQEELRNPPGDFQFPTSELTSNWV